MCSRNKDGDEDGAGKWHRRKRKKGKGTVGEGGRTGADGASAVGRPA